MTLDEFRARKDTLSCLACGHIGLVEEHVLQNNAYRVVCPCGNGQPLGIPFLKHRGGPRTRRPLTRSGESVEEVWAAWGGKCLGCGLTKDELALLGLGCERHHAPPLAESDGEDETILLPHCTECHGGLTFFRQIHRRQLAAVRSRQAKRTVADLVARFSLPAQVTQAPEVRDAVERSIDESNRHRAHSEAVMMVAIDSNPLTYLVEAIEPGYDPTTDNAGLRAERVAMVRCYLYGGVAFWVMPTVEARYNRIQKPERHLQHQRAAWVLLHDAPIGAPQESIAARATELRVFHSDAEDCQIVAEAEHAGVPALVTLDQKLIDRLTPHTRLGLRRPSEFFASLGIEAEAEPVLTPHPSNPLASARWWRV